MPAQATDALPHRCRDRGRRRPGSPRPAAIDQPQRLQGVHVEFEATSPDLSELLRQLGLPAPPLPELQVQGELVRDGEVWQLSEAYAQVGESELSGAAQRRSVGGRVRWSAPTSSRSRLRLADFVPAKSGAADGDDAASEAAAAPAVPLIEDGDINLKALPAIDADLELRAGARRAAGVPVRPARARSPAARSGGGDRCDRRGQVPRAAAELRGPCRHRRTASTNPDAAYPVDDRAADQRDQPARRGQRRPPAQPDRPRRRRGARRPGSRPARRDPAAAAAGARRPTTSRARSPTRPTSSAGTWWRCSGTVGDSDLVRRRQLRARRRAPDHGRRPALQEGRLRRSGRAGRRADRDRAGRDRIRRAAAGGGRRRGLALRAAGRAVRRSRAARDRRQGEVPRRQRPGQQAAARAHGARPHAGGRQAELRAAALRAGGRRVRGDHEPRRRERRAGRRVRSHAAQHQAQPAARALRHRDRRHRDGEGGRRHLRRPRQAPGAGQLGARARRVRQRRARGDHGRRADQRADRRGDRARRRRGARPAGQRRRRRSSRRWCRSQCLVAQFAVAGRHR